MNEFTTMQSSMEVIELNECTTMQIRMKTAFRAASKAELGLGQS
jgi:hypothetical protein